MLCSLESNLLSRQSLVIIFNEMCRLVGFLLRALSEGRTLAIKTNNLGTSKMKKILRLFFVFVRSFFSSLPLLGGSHAGELIQKIIATVEW